MIFWRAKELLEGGGELLRAEAELVSKRLRIMLINSAFFALSLLLGLIGLLLVLAGVILILSQSMALSSALLLVGGGMLVLCVCVWAAVMIIRAPAASDPAKLDSATPRQDAREAKEKMHDAATPGQAGARPGPEDGVAEDGPHPSMMPEAIDDLKDAAMDVATRNPIAVGSAAFLALSLIGPGRAVRMISRGIAAAGIASSLIETVGAHSRTHAKKK